MATFGVVLWLWVGLVQRIRAQSQPWYPYPTSYTAGSDWVQACYTGAAQSPINFDACQTPMSRTEIGITWNATMPLLVTNDGKAIKLSSDGLDIPGGMTAGGKSYTFVQCHFHWGSEHSVSYDQYPFEVHCVHTRDDASGRYGVFGVFYTIGSEDPFLQTLIDGGLPPFPVSGESTNVTHSSVDVNALYGSVNRRNYWDYEGSFTTPGCDELVDFYIMMEPLTMSQAQLDAFKAEIGWAAEGGNFRPAQPLNGRTVGGCTSEAPWYPYPHSDNGPNAWNSLCYTGQAQSPISFTDCAPYKRDNRAPVQITWAEQNTTLVNTGYGLQLNFPATAPGKMMVQNKTYTLVQCHFHWSSEHRVNNVMYPMEVHCVHSEDGGTGRYGVFGVFYELGDGGDDEDPFLTTLMAGTLPAAPAATTRRLAASTLSATTGFSGVVDMKRLYGTLDLTQYYDYQGSFTTPPCTEAVDFYIMMRPLTMSQAQLAAFQEAIGWKTAGGNYRPPQPLNGRTVRGCGESLNWYPYPARDAPNAWDALCYDGTKQSPVDFPSCPTYQRNNRPAVQVTWQNQAVQLKNTENAVQLDAAGATPGQMMVGNKTYTLVQCHWHWGSEHFVGGHQYPLEVHCVHSLDGSNPTSYGVFGMFYELGAENSFLSQFIGQLPLSPYRRLAGAASETTISSFVGPVDFTGLYVNLDLSQFYNYEGSFTTPPCTEAVEFYIMMNPQTLSQPQLDAFKEAIGWTTAMGNFRPPQPLNGREIGGCSVTGGGNWYPYPTSPSAPNAWDALCYSGTMQSPVNFEACAAPETRTAISLAWNNSQSASLVNEGSSVKLAADPSGPPGKMTAGGKTYTLVQCHFHWGSEHTVGYDQYPLEVHCVHSEDGGTGRYGVFGLFYTLGAENSGLAQFIGSLPQLPGRRLASGSAESTVSSWTGPMDFGALASGVDLTRYWSYQGSFTTPPCSELVDFYIMVDPVTLSQAQLTAMQDAMGWKAAGGNFRPPQPLNGRQVSGCTTEAKWYPYPVNDSAANPWPELCYTGQAQSPIDFAACPTYQQSNRAPVELSWQAQSITLKNNEHTIVLHADGESPGKMKVQGKDYTLVQCHFHWGAEHFVAGTQHPFEVHCVHSEDNSSPQRYGVFGVFYQVGAEDPFLQTLIGASLPTAGATSPFTGPLDLSMLYSRVDRTRYYDYQGSFTTPPCTEAVDFYIMMEPITLSQAQLDAFKTAIGWQSAGGNFRPPQNLNGRTVGGCSATANWYPYATSQSSPNAWDALCYTGQAQSPINFDICESYQIANRAPVQITWAEQPARLTNNGHALQLNAEGSEPGKMMVQGKTYTLVQCHFHWGAEHTVGNAQHPFEVHCVHSEDGTGRYGVFGVFYQLGSADPFLAKLLNGGAPSSPNRRLASRYTSGFSGSLELKELYGSIDLTKYWSYEGSFTTPPCSELVDFYIMMEPLTISQAQLDALKSAIGWQAAGGNFRPPQPLNGRNVSGCRAGSSNMNWYPYPAAGAANAWDALCYSGTRQSPVNFETCAPASMNNRQAIQITWENQSTVLKNTGDAVVMAAAGGSAGTGKMMVQGRTYTLVQCHWHWGSEHTVGGYQYPLEVHCVHTKDGSNPLSYGVFGFFYELGEENAFLQHLLTDLPMSPYRRLAGAASDTTISSFAGPVDFKALYGDLDLTTYYDYQGSFTTPPCTEAVEFYIMMGAQTLSQAQLDAFKRAIGWAEAGGNFRPPQPLYGRQVGGCTATGNWYPYPSSQDAPNAWDTLCYTGQAQSPVAFDSCSAPETRTAINITWTAAQQVTLANTGYSVKLTADAANPGKMVAGGKTYTLVQCHFHWGSEHTVGYDQYPLEVHCVHSEDGTSRYGVFGIFYEVGAENAALQQFIADLPQLPGRRLASDTVSAWTGPMDFRSLYGSIDLTKYWSYEGSFTTPPCTEAVDFYIMMEPVTLSQEQLTLMRAAQGWTGAGGNFRPPQPLNGRTVSGCSATPAWYPYPPADTGANAWPSICYSGTEQSPIDFATCPNYRRANREKIRISWAPQPITLSNNGHAVQLSAGASMPGKMMVHGKNFTLVQCHFHYGSEHFVAGVQHPFEVHCVHSEDNSSPQRYGVFGVLYELGRADPFLDTLIAGSLPASPNSAGRRLASSVTTSAFAGPVDLTRLYHDIDLTKYYDYRGSFTTPPCTEAVTFYIMMQTLTISQAQLDSFKTAIGWQSAGGNFRPPQPLHGRQVGGCNADPNWYPYGSSSSSNAWNSLCYTGLKQSPIDFDSCPTYQRQNRYPVQLSWTNQTVALKHTENAVQLDATSASPGKMTVRDNVYTLVQCHWHWGSEHTVDGRQYPLEVHCVHVKDGSHPTSYGVFGFFYEVGEENQFLKHFINDLPHSPGRRLAGAAADITTSSFVGPINFVDLYDKDMTTYYNYEGSFTTPPCTEAVEFYIMMQPATLSQAQLEAFKVAIGWPNEGGNFRPPQPLNGREVHGCAARGNWYPAPASSSAANAWPALCYSGTAQSPVDLPLCAVPDNRTGLQLTWQSGMSAALSNNGYTVQLDAPSTTGKMTVNGKTYTLSECHFHYGSEHTIGTQQMPLEVECVHSADDSSGRSAVFVILYTLGAANAFLDELVGSLPFSPLRRLAPARKLSDPTVVTIPGPLDLNGLYTGVDLTKYLSYAGSKTTPPCTEAMDYYIARDMLTISEAQLNAFKRAIGWEAAGGNYRPTQPLNGRHIQGCAEEASSNWYPYPAASQVPSVWPALCYSGQKQSPVNFEACPAEQRSNRAPVQVTWPEQQVRLINTGHSLQLDPQGAAKGQMMIREKTYSLVQCHFHWGSEHTVNSSQYVMEVHCVHSDDANPGQYGVVGVFYTLGAEDPFLASLMSTALPGQPGQPGGSARRMAAESAEYTVGFAGSVDVKQLFGGSMDMTKYYSYEGSFTTPPCTEAVTFYIMMNPVTLSQAQLDAFKSAMGWQAAGGNFRPPQPLNGRSVAGCASETDMNWYPYPAQTAPNAWPALCYSGLKQSPIDFEACPSSRLPNRRPIQITWESQSVQLINTENAVQLNAAAQRPGKMVVQGQSYTLVQCHWHRGSEHTVAGYQYPLEVHCVHTKDGSDPLTYGVFGLFYELGEENAFLQQFINELPLSPRRLAEVGSDSTVSSFQGPVDLRGLFGNVDLTSYRDYEGSFTTPPCTEAVDFYIMTGVQTLSQLQLHKFEEAIGWPSVPGNFRPPQPLNGRSVGGCAAQNNLYPYPMAYSNASGSWDEVCYTGQAQSPVNFDSCATPETQSAITVNWPTSQTVSFLNNGYTLQLSATSNPGQMTANGKTYTLKGCHFHWGSEHTIGYDQFAMEIHCVHSEDGSNPQRYGVLGLFYELGAADPGLDQFIGRVPPLPRVGEVAASAWTGPMNFRTLFANADMTKYYNYQGSFTTPPCTEVVDFFILMQPGTMSQAQYDTLKASMGWSRAGGNFRPVQPLNGRQVRGCSTAAAWYPYPTTDTPNNAWPSVCYQGRKQSPINFEACPVHRRSNRAPVQVSWAVQEVSLLNNGHAIQLSAGGTSPGKMTVGGRSFTLVQCHFHYGSEHFVANVQHVFEVHCVHTEDNTSPQKYGVFGVLYELGDADPFLATLIGGQLPSSPGRRLALNSSLWDGRRMASAASSPFTGPMDFTRLYRNIDLTKYYDYEGSFTTPPCTEAVTFFIMMETLTMSQAQLDSFKAAIGWGAAGGNFRPPQPLWGREVGGCSEQPNWYPYAAAGAQNAWPEDICYTGRAQSPVDFETCPSHQRTNRAHVQIGWGTHSVVLKNTENAIQLDAQGTPGKMVIKDKSYTLVQCHWHWGSEHTVNGRQYPLEVHCVHTKDGSPGKYGVFGLFYDLGAENSFLQQFIKDLPMSPARRLAGAASDATVSTFTGPVDFSGLFGSTDLTQYYDYHGSFTTPPCTEAVDFYIMMQPQTVSQAQLDAMKTAIGWGAVGGNYRPTQPLNGREVGGCSSSGNWYPYPQSESAPNAWPALCYQGTRQSPINFADCAGATRAPIQVTWGEQQSVELRNDGQTVTIAANAAQAGKMQVNGRTYTLAQCHFHWGSEHTVGGVQQPFEIHCVHTEDNSSPQRYGVLGVMFEMGPTNPGLDQFLQHLPLSPGRRLAEAGSNASISSWSGPISFSQLFQGVDRSKYYSYQGSFTTPPCTEAVDFYIFMDRLTMSEAQLDMLKEAMGWQSAGGNFRPPQPLMGREVAGCLLPDEEPTSSAPSSGPPSVWALTALAAVLLKITE